MIIFHDFHLISYIEATSWASVSMISFANVASIKWTSTPSLGRVVQPLTKLPLLFSYSVFFF